VLLVDDHTREKISHNGKRISPETKGVIVDDHTRGEISHSGKKNITRDEVEGDIPITPSTKGSVFIISDLYM
jgi:hypothetical protein